MFAWNRKTFTSLVPSFWSILLNGVSRLYMAFSLYISMDTPGPLSQLYNRPGNDFMSKIGRTRRTSRSSGTTTALQSPASRVRLIQIIFEHIKCASLSLFH
ncbi:hypothetical protein AOQ84DRAFT_18751 [Glonium stellatum]|uniref:Uncharacterized protein n=1 Tax=Glonium stellatum TaxID=574774 RepID=A0A8E2FCT2_9PEZI|nr:hypothetical protein AOQ84DRAFT_18751 [Glonium stellatum]